MRVGAFRKFAVSKKELLWEAHLLFHSRFKPIVYKQTLFEKIETPKFKLPPLSLEHQEIEDAYDQIELLNFAILSPFKLANESITSNLVANDLSDLLGKTVRIYGYLVTTKTIRTKHKKLMAFGYFYDLQGGFFDTTHFPQVFEKYPFRGYGVYEVKGKVAEEFVFYSVEAKYLRKLEIKPDPRTVSEFEHTNDTVILVE